MLPKNIDKKQLMPQWRNWLAQESYTFKVGGSSPSCGTLCAMQNSLSVVESYFINVFGLILYFQ